MSNAVTSPRATAPREPTLAPAIEGTPPLTYGRSTAGARSANSALGNVFNTRGASNAYVDVGDHSFELPPEPGYDFVFMVTLPRDVPPQSAIKVNSPWGQEVEIRLPSKSGIPRGEKVKIMIPSDDSKLSPRAVHMSASGDELRSMQGRACYASDTEEEDLEASREEMEASFAQDRDRVIEQLKKLDGKGRCPSEYETAARFMTPEMMKNLEEEMGKGSKESAKGELCIVSEDGLHQTIDLSGLSPLEKTLKTAEVMKHIARVSCPEGVNVDDVQVKAEHMSFNEGASFEEKVSAAKRHLGDAPADKTVKDIGKELGEMVECTAKKSTLRAAITRRDFKKKPTEPTAPRVTAEEAERNAAALLEEVAAEQQAVERKKSKKKASKAKKAAKAALGAIAEDAVSEEPTLETNLEPNLEPTLEPNEPTLVDLRDAGSALERDDAATSVATALQCVVCMKEERCVACVPCGHIAVCESCGKKDVLGKKCPMCRTEVAWFMRVYQ